MIDISKKNISVPFDESMWKRRNSCLSTKFTSYAEYLAWYNEGKKILLDLHKVEQIERSSR